MSKVYNVGVVGYGLSAKIFHIPFINDAKSFHLHSIVQRSPKPGDDASQDFKDVKVYKSVEELLKDAEIDVVVLTTTPATHFDLASQVIRAKKSVLVEKPFTPTSDEARKLVALAREQGVFLTVYQNRRYDSDFQTLKQLIQHDKLGRIVEFETHFDRHRPGMPSRDSWKGNPDSYSAVFDLGTHLIDQVISLNGLPKSITGFVKSQRGARNTIGLEDSFTALLHYDDLMATAKAAVVSPEQQQLRYWIRGEKASFKKFHLDPQEDQLKAGLRPGDKGYGEEAKDHYGILSVATDSGVNSEQVPTIESAGYTEFYNQFARALDANDASLLPVTPDQAVDLIHLIELVQRSSAEGKTLPV